MGLKTTIHDIIRMKGVHGVDDIIDAVTEIVKLRVEQQTEMRVDAKIKDTNIGKLEADLQSLKLHLRKRTSERDLAWNEIKAMKASAKKLYSEIEKQVRHEISDDEDTDYPF